MRKLSDVLKVVRDRFYPAVLCFVTEGYSAQRFVKDLLAGVIVGVVAIPLAIAFGIASGVSPVQGLITGVVAGFIISALSGSRVQIGGPTGAFIVIIYGIVSKYGFDGLAVATIIAGLLLVLMGVFGFGELIRYVPYPVTIGFTSGIALTIFAGQIKSLLGLHMETVPAGFVEKIIAYGQHIGSTEWLCVVVSLATIIICVRWHRVTQKIPGSLAAILVTTVAVYIVRQTGLADAESLPTIGDFFPVVKEGMSLPKPRLPSISFTAFRELFPAAISIALLAGIESLLSAVVADGMTGKKHNSNTELIAQGVANICSPLFGGIPATGAIARTATNIKNGGSTPVAGIVHAILLLLVMLFLGRLAALIPMATLAGIVAVVAYNMSEWRYFIKMFRSTHGDTIVMIVTFLLTVLIDLTVAIQAGILLAAVFFIKRAAETTKVGYITQGLAGHDDTTVLTEEDDPFSIHTRQVPEGVEVFEVRGALFFGAADKFKDALAQVGVRPKILILRLRHVLALDATALHALEYVWDQTRREGTRLVLSGVHSQPLFVMQRSGFISKVGEDNVHMNIDDALARAAVLLEELEEIERLAKLEELEKNKEQRKKAVTEDSAEEQADEGASERD